LPGFVAVRGESVIGLVTFHIDNSNCEIVSLDSKAENQGIGSALIWLVRNVAKRDGCTRLWLITFNDNIRAIRFYQKRGFDMKRIQCNAIDEARKIKPSIPVIGAEGTMADGLHRMREQLNSPIYFIRGNHEGFGWLHTLSCKSGESFTCSILLAYFTTRKMG
jgi:hypothetical protein